MSFNEDLNNQTSDHLDDEDISQISGVDLQNWENLLTPDEKFEIEESYAPTAMKKLLVIGGGVGISVLILFWLFAGFTPSKVSNSEQPPKETTNTELSEQKNDEQVARLQAELALKDQQLSQPSELTIKKQEKETKLEIKPEPQPQLQKQVQSRPKPKPQPQPQKRVSRRQSQQRVKEVDPQKRWDELVEIGAYKSKEATNNNQVNSVNQQRDTIVSSQRVTNNNPRSTLNSNRRGRVTPVVNRSESITLIDSNSIPRQNVSALIQGGLAVPANSRTSNQLKVPIVLSEPITDRSGKTLISSGATIVADVSLDGSIVNLTPQTIAFEKNGEYFELNLDDSVIVTGDQGPIIANLQTLGDNNSLSVDQISQIVGLTGVLGDDVRDLSVATSILSANNRNRNRRRNIVQLYTLAKNTSVTIRIVKNIPFQVGDTNLTTISSTKLRTELDFETTGLSFDETDENNDEYLMEGEMLTNDEYLTDEEILTAEEIVEDYE